MGVDRDVAGAGVDAEGSRRRAGGHVPAAGVEGEVSVDAFGVDRAGERAELGAVAGRDLDRQVAVEQHLSLIHI